MNSFSSTRYIMARPGLVFDVMMIILDQQAVLDFSKASSLNNPWIDMFIEPMICPTRDKHTMDAVTDYDYSNYFHLTKNTC
jgi:hypothetical protein